MLLTHLRRAQDDIDDADPIGALMINGRLVGRPWIVARTLLHWTSEQPPVASATVVLSAEVYGDSRFVLLTLSVEAVAALCADIEASISQIPVESRFHVWDDMPGRAFDAHGSRDWVFEEYRMRDTAVKARTPLICAGRSGLGPVSLVGWPANPDCPSQRRSGGLGLNTLGARRPDGAVCDQPESPARATAIVAPRPPAPGDEGTSAAHRPSAFFGPSVAAHSYQSLEH